MTEKWGLCSDVVGNLAIKGKNQSIGSFQCQYLIDLLNKQDEMINELENENKRLKNKLELYEHYVTFTAIDDDDEVL